jgi:hypothetical protein
LGDGRRIEVGFLRQRWRTKRDATLLLQQAGEMFAKAAFQDSDLFISHALHLRRAAIAGGASRGHPHQRPAAHEPPNIQQVCSMRTIHSAITD